jgi:hypothetical protein
MKRLLILLLLLVPVCAFAAENLTGLDQDGKSVMVKDGFGFLGEVVTGNATVVEKSGMVINRATNATATISYIPRVGQFFAIAQRDVHTATATVTLPTGWTWNGTNKSITFNAAAEALVGFVPYTGRVIIVENVGTVGFAD